MTLSLSLEPACRRFSSTLRMEWFLKRKQVSTSLATPCPFNFVFRLFGNKDSSDTKLGSEGPAIVDKWLALQLAPLATLELPGFLKYFEDIFLRTFPLPFFFVKSDYSKLYDAFYASSSSVLDKAESFGIKRDEACHNLVFLAGFNAFGGYESFVSYTDQVGRQSRGEVTRPTCQ
ncbi:HYDROPEROXIDE LYASE [Salix purpurea]|uniref:HYDROPEROXIDE LYASE n=1 Tax=Salix purpurea TaxID=77065 RepID=A0A9Q0UQ47_SALPP|nr:HYDROPEROXIDE LYASE [Salix purpurea]